MADPIVGLVITAAILMVLVGAARDVFRRLMDGVDPQIVGSAEVVLAAVPGVDGVAGLRMRWVGHTLHAEADLDVAPETALRDAHELAHRAEHALIEGVPRLATAQVHAYPGHDVGDAAVTRPAERSLRPPTRRQTT